MIKDNIIYNERMKPNSREIEVLKNNFPQYFDKDVSSRVSDYKI